ncbi:hypothetical protein M2T54_28805, partial [Klebsiella pneumoniae]|nr:hypothetical protein [Klebsiella pneumoniae]
DPWPVKVIGLFLWVIIMFCLPSFINRDKEKSCQIQHIFG